MLRKYRFLIHFAVVAVVIFGQLLTTISYAIATSWLGTWAYRIPITIADADVTADIPNFPVTLQLDGSSGKTGANLSAFFNELATGANRKKIAVTTNDGTTQLYVEIEGFDISLPRAILHVGSGNGTWSLLNAGDTLYLYFDKNQPENTAWVNDVGSGGSVYDSTYKYLNHMANYNIDAFKSQSFIAGATEDYFIMEADINYVANATHPFKLWLHTNGPASSLFRINYYYSDTGMGNWTKVGLASPDSSYGAPSVLTNPNGDGKYIMISEPAPAWPPVNFDMLSSNNETGFTLVTANIVSKSTNSSKFDYSGIANPHVWIEGSTWFMAYVGVNSAHDSPIVWRVGLATSTDNGTTWTKSYNGTGWGGSLLFPGEIHSDSGSIFKIGSTYYHAGHGNWNGGIDVGTDVQNWYSSTDLVNWAPVGGSGFQSFITRSQQWEGVNSNEGQTADLCAVLNDDGTPITINGQSYFYYTAVDIQTPDATHPMSFGVVQLPVTFQEYILNGVNTLIDSTTNHNDPNFLNDPIATTALGNALQYRNNSNGKTFLGVNSSSSLTSITNNFTFVAYLSDSYSTTSGYILHKDGISAGTRQFSFQTDLAEDGSRSPGVYFWDTSNNLNYFGGPTSNLSVGMHRLICTKDGSNNRHVYLDGSEITPLSYNSGAGGNMKSATANMYIGYRAYDGGGITGTIDEVGLMADVWSAARVAADNKNITDVLVTYGSVESLSVAPDDGGIIWFWWF